MMSQDPTGTDDLLLTGRTNRRRFLVGIAAAGLAPMTITPEARLSLTTQAVGGATMARQAEQTAVTNTLAVPGASLYYETSGSGPVLLLIPGGAADAAIFALIVGLLAERYTVVSYDPRGISRSRLEGPAEDVPVELHADDAQLLLTALGAEPAFVLGSSGGAVIGLALADRHPARVQTLVAHEPPLLALLPEGSEGRRSGREIYDTYQKEGAEAATQQFMAVTGLGEAGSGPPTELSPEMQEMMGRIQQNEAFFYAHYLLPITDYLPDIAKLQGGSTRVVVGVGEDSRGQLAYETALALAKRLGVPPVTFPGGHAGYLDDPAAFAAKLDEVFQAGSPA